MLAATHLTIGVQHGADVFDHLLRIGIAIVERVGSEDHPGSMGKKLLDDLPANRQRVNPAVGEGSLPGWGVQHRWLCDRADGSATRRDQLDLWATNDLEFLG